MFVKIQKTKSIVLKPFLFHKRVAINLLAEICLDM